MDEATSTVHHDVTMSMMPELLARPQFRHASVDGDHLTLSATTTDDAGATTHSTLVWRRAARPVAASRPRVTGGSIAWWSTMATRRITRTPEPEDDDEHGRTADGRVP